MNFKTTLILLVLLALLGGFVFVMRDRAPNYEEEQKRRQAAAQGLPIFTADQVKATEIDTLTLTHQGKSATFRKTGNTWQQVEPVAYPLTSWMVDDLVNEVVALKYRESFTPGQKDQPAPIVLGLEPAQATLTLGKSADASTKITLEAGRTFTGGMAYVRVKDQPQVYVVGDSLVRQLTDDPVNRLRQKSLVTPIESQSDELTLSTIDQGIVKLTKTQGRWHLQDPHTGRGSREAISSLLTTLGSASVQKFIADAPEDLSRYGLDQPRLTLTVVSSKVEPSADVKPVTQTLRIGGPTDLDNTSYFAAWTQGDDKPAVMTLAADVLNRLQKKLDDLRDPKLTQFKAGDIRHLVLKHSGPPLALTRSANGWEFDDAQIKFQADDALVSELVEAITSVKAIEFWAHEKPRNASSLAIELKALGQNEPVILDVWERKKDEQGQPTWLVLPRHEEVSMLVPAQKLINAMAPAWQLRDRTLVDLPVDRVNRLELIRQGQSPMVLTRLLPTPVAEVTVGTSARDKASPWTLEGDDKASLDQTKLGQLVGALSPLKAHRWLEPGTQPGEAKYTLRASTDQGKSIELVVDEKGVATLREVDQPFELPESVIKLLDQPYLDPAQTQPAAKSAD